MIATSTASPQLDSAKMNPPVTNQVSTQLAGKAITSLVGVIHSNRDYLSTIDGAIGDGDHGINMDTGFSHFAKEVEGTNPNLPKALDTLGNTLLNVTGGSLGPLYGSMFIAMGESLANDTVIDASGFSAMLRAGLTSIQDIGGAKRGDKSLLDALIPAVDSFDAARAGGKTFYDALTALCDGAEEGKESTRDMIAKIGRASRLGERSRGVLDAGATSCCIMLQSLAKSFQKLLNQESVP